MRLLKNILINTRNNKLRVADVRFNDKINEIIWKTDEFDWEEISTEEKKKNFFARFAKHDFTGESIDGNFNLLMPGGIDPHVHFNTPGFEDREDFEHGTAAAAFGGVTTIIDMPCTSLPPVTNLQNMNEKLKALEGRSLIDFAFRGGVRGNDFDNKEKVSSQIKELAETGVVGFKVYVISGMDTFTDLTYEQIEFAAEEIKSTGKPMCVHAEDKELVVSRRAKLQAEGNNSWKAYCEARDVKAELTAVNKIIEIAERTNTTTHIVHLSSGKALEAITEAQKRGVKISAETCPHYLYFTQDDFANPAISAFLKTAPPVKFEEDKNALWRGLSENQLAFVTTDHAGCIPEKEKSSENFWEVYGGIPGVEHRVPFLFSEGFLKNKLTLEQTINLLSTNVAEFYNLKSKGRIEQNYDADFALINLWETETVKAEHMHSKGKYTPFEGVKFNSIVETTFLRGKVISSRRMKTEEEIGYGKFVRVD
jgi:allantoinase